MILRSLLIVATPLWRELCGDWWTCVCTYVYIYIHILYVYKYTFIYLYMCTFFFCDGNCVAIDEYICVHICTFMYTYIDIWIRFDINVYVYIFFSWWELCGDWWTYMCTYMYIYIHILYVYKYTLVHIYVNIFLYVYGWQRSALTPEIYTYM